jgi:hypothetical protein
VGVACGRVGRGDTAVDVEVSSSVGPSAGRAERRRSGRRRQACFTRHAGLRGAEEKRDDVGHFASGLEPPEGKPFGDRGGVAVTLGKPLPVGAGIDDPWRDGVHEDAVRGSSVAVAAMSAVRRALLSEYPESGS